MSENWKQAVINVPPPPSKQCGLCEEQIATVRVVVATLEGEVIDVVETCDLCARGPCRDLELILRGRS